MTQEYDFKGALDAIDNFTNAVNGGEVVFTVAQCAETIKFALRLADKLQSSEVSEGMNKVGWNRQHPDAIFKAMTKQLLEEVKDE